MDLDKLQQAQQGIPLSELTGRTRRGRVAAGLARAARGEAVRGAAPAGPLLSPGSLTAAERRRLLEGLEQVIDGLYAHLPLKRARYGFDPVQRLRILRIQADTLDDDAFHVEVARLTTQLRDAHTRYAGPATLRRKVAALPFLVETVVEDGRPLYVVTKVGSGLDPAFKPGVVIEYWNGTPIDRAVMRHGEDEVGGRPDSRRAWATQSLTFRSLRYSPPPDEHWVVVGYRAAGGEARPEDAVREIRIPWRVVDPGELAALQGTDEAVTASHRTRMAVDPAAADVRRAKMLMFAPAALVGEQPPADASNPASTTAAATEIVPTRLTQTLRAMKIDGPGGPYGHLRIFAFDADPDEFVAELQRLIPLLPEAGLVIDIRGNPGGYIWAAETALQLFTPKPIQPTRFSLLATALTRTMAGKAGLAEELQPWKASLTDAVRNGELYSQPLPITDPVACNAIGQQYGGPVVLVGDCTTYSSGDLFSAGFVDNGIGPFLCVGDATGAGGANVWNYDELRQFVDLPTLPDGIGLTFSFRRVTRAGPSEGLPIEDIGVSGIPYAMTLRDLLSGNRDLLDACIKLLRRQPASRLHCTNDAATRKVTARTEGLTRLDAYVDGHPLASIPIRSPASTAVDYPAGAKALQLVGYAGDEVRQRRTVSLHAA